MNMTRITNRLTLMLIAAVLCLSAPAVQAQDEPFDPREAVKKISEGFDTILESLNEMSATDASVSGSEVVDNIDKLLDSMKAAQDDVVKNIDDLIRNQKRQNSNSSSSSGSSKGQPKQGSSGQPQGKQGGGKKRDRNQSDGEGKKPGDQKKEEAGKKPGEDGEPQGEKSTEKSEQTNGGRRPSDKPQEVYRQILEAGGWGYLPDEMKQRLIESNFRDWFPDYDREIRDYLKSLSGSRRRR